MTGATVVQARDLSVRIGQTRILDRVTFSVGEGEYLAVIGPNGAGKTTLVRSLIGLWPHQGGTVTIRGKPLSRYRQKELAAVVGYVPQADGGPLPFTVREFVLMGRYPHLSPFTALSASDRDAADRALEQTALSPLAGRRMDTLSGGERQKVFIAAALAQEARVLLLDEPTTFLDPLHQDEVLGILTRLNSEAGVTIVSVTHDINSAAMISDRVMALKDGRVAFIGPPADLMVPSTLKGIFGKTFLFTPHPLTGEPVIVPGGEGGAVG